MWTSPHQGTGIRYYPHRTPNDTFAGFQAIGAPIAGGTQGPIYVEVTLSQWSNPPASNGGNHCGKGDHRSTWVGCVHPGNQRGWGRDVLDREWQEQVMIPLKCDPGDVVGVFKYSWGHDAHWHCSRQANLGVVINHDGIESCKW